MSTLSGHHIPDVKTTVSAYDRVVQLVTNNKSHVHDSKQIKEQDSKQKNIYYSLNITFFLIPFVDFLGLGNLASNSDTLALKAFTAGINNDTNRE